MNSSNIDNQRCPVCESRDLDIFIEINQMPVHCHLLQVDRETAVQVPKGDIRLAFCVHCSHIFNLAFDPGLMEYTQDYENSLFFSPRFRDYVDTLAKRLIDKYGLYGKDIVEIGSGKGDFLRLLCELGNNRGLGFDPGYRPDLAEKGDGDSVSFIPDVYSEKYADHHADLICSRHTLEHILYPVEFLKIVHKAIRNRSDTVVFFEVPNALFTLRDMGIWDIIYEHYSYFSSFSLSYLFNRCGFHIREVAEAYNGQFLTLEALPVQEPLAKMSEGWGNPNAIREDVRSFGEIYLGKVGEWQKTLDEWQREGHRVVIWGAGSKGVSFLNTLKVSDGVSSVVDINPRKQGMYIAGTGQEIVSPDFLKIYRPDFIIVMNSIYVDEIRTQVMDLGITAKLYTA